MPGCRMKRPVTENAVEGRAVKVAHTTDDSRVDSIADNARIGVEICCGTIVSVRCKIRVEGNEKLTSIITSLSDDAQAGGHIHLIARSDDGRYLLDLLAESGSGFAVINSKVTSALRSLQYEDKLQNIRLDVIARKDDILQASKRVVRTAIGLFGVEINVYCNEHDAIAIGQRLSENQIFLQPPIHQRDLSAYSNPHMVSFVGITPEEINSSLEVPSNVASHRSDDWSVVLDTLPQHHAEATFSQDGNVATILMPHQMDGVDFMQRRETGCLPESLRLWESYAGPQDKLNYYHKVTADKCYGDPVEPSSGILADEMGIGKTLTTIANIASSMDRATKFMCSSSQQVADDVIRTKATLIVVPSLLILESWVKEIEQRMQPGSLRTSTYHGHKRVSHVIALKEFDMVFATYGTVTVEFRKNRKILYNTEWFRVVLDEAHTIRTQTTKQFEAIMLLKAKHRWCLTGTPMSNKVDDLGALLRFCRVPLLEERKYFDEHITKVTRRSRKQGDRVLRQILGPLCLRRTRKLLKLPEPQVVECNINFTRAETNQYEQILQRCKRAIDSSVSSQGSGHTQHILRTILALRIFCNQGTYTVSDYQPGGDFLDPDEQLTLLQEHDEECCCQCGNTVTVINQPEDPNSGVLNDCAHLICCLCYTATSGKAASTRTFPCPICPSQKMLEPYQSTEATASFLPNGQSSKLEKLIENLELSVGKEKSIVFSVWKKTLDLASMLLSRRSIKHTRVDGKTKHAARTKALEDFSSDGKTSVLLMTLGTGAFGLNLTAATRIHLLEPQWNPSVEKQAIGRAVRIGQERTAVVTRYIIRDSVEKQIQGYQQRKLHLVAGGFGEFDADQESAEAALLTASFFQDA